MSSGFLILFPQHISVAVASKIRHWCDMLGCAALLVCQHLAEARADLKHALLLGSA